MIAGLSLQNAFLLLLAVAGFWFTARFLVGPRRGAPSLRAMFTREKPAHLEGLGQEAIATLIGDTRRFAIGEPGLRGLILAGPFAVKAAEAASPVTLIALCETIAPYTGKAWLDRWAYPARGHLILEHVIENFPNGAGHRLVLRGAPPISIHFTALDALEPPEVLYTALAEGAETIEDPSGLADKLRLRWCERANLAQRIGA